MYSKVEVAISIVFILGGFIKISILLLCTCKGIAKIFKCTNYRSFVMPVTLLMINLSYFQYESILYYNEFQTKIWAYFTLPFHVILPIFIFMVAEIKNKRSINSL